MTRKSTNIVSFFVYLLISVEEQIEKKFNMKLPTRSSDTYGSLKIETEEIKEDFVACRDMTCNIF